MNHSYRDAISRLSDNSLVCPKCGGSDLVSREKTRPFKDEMGVVVMDGNSPALETYDSHKCFDCGQHFITQVKLIWCCAVEYVNEVGDCVRPDAPLTEML
jgi:predicted RNA-binding Zn-ribbon protein involved in translation (DUF1610 family)